MRLVIGLPPEIFSAALNLMVPPAGLEPALREEADFESAASTSSAREATSAPTTGPSQDATLPNGTEFRQYSLKEIGRCPEFGPKLRLFATLLRRLDQVIFVPGWEVHFKYDERGYWYVQLQTSAACNVSGEMERQHGRKWLISEHMTDSEIVQTVFKAYMSALEHEAREQFKFCGQSIFDPHYDLVGLAQHRASRGALQHRS